MLVFSLWFLSVRLCLCLSTWPFRPWASHSRWLWQMVSHTRQLANIYVQLIHSNRPLCALHLRPLKYRLFLFKNKVVLFFYANLLNTKQARLIYKFSRLMVEILHRIRSTVKWRIYTKRSHMEATNTFKNTKLSPDDWIFFKTKKFQLQIYSVY